MIYRITAFTAWLLVSALILSTPKTRAMGGSGPYEGLKDAAKRTVIAVETPASSGSGIVIGKRGSTYYFITAKHVAQGNPIKEEFFA